ncbi:sucrose phosphorylase [Alteromonas sp. 1_MG-2023]|uniref:sucrose phosphorylase n=1 Tax=Alteromonas sp. 1_MG-2023 TaxID=3062669 RepID=UPI0026E1D875|nr:sucrose phosphorylase [Alteromonas sp. 1_MG-2023]MDO6566441.1 sucrose phosphorylase [Alteromonas sp. 1_MG-2023]
MSLRNGVQLITYADRLGEGNMSGLNKLLNTKLKGLFTGIHILPFYYPYDGEDAGFDPIDHTTVDERLGSWADVKQVGESMNIMADLIVNHMSAQSEPFLDVIKQGRESQYWPLFLTKQSVFIEDDEANIANVEEGIKKVFRPRPTPFFSEYELDNKEVVPFWTTFTANQIDIDVESELGKAYLESILQAFTQSNVDLIRLDAAGYAIKRAGTNCFMLEETFEFIEELSNRAHAMGIQSLVEIHSHFETQIAIASRCDSVYDFALPPLVLHTLFSKDASALARWLSISPRNCFTVLDTHDGIGIVDVGASGDKPGLLTHVQIDNLVKTIHVNSDGESRKATGEAASNVDLYQINCTYYDALGKDDEKYLLARAIQFFSPGVPQVYYAGLLGATNDMELLAKTNVGRDINRPYLSENDIDAALLKPVVKGLIALIQLRNNTKAFNGDFSVTNDEKTLLLVWTLGDDRAELRVEMSTLEAHITVIENGVKTTQSLAQLTGL